MANHGQQPKEQTMTTTDTDIEIRLDAPNGPLVEYPAADPADTGNALASDIEAAVPAGWRVDWAAAPYHLPSGRRTSPLVRVDAAPKVKSRTITLTSRAPVTIREDEWPMIADADWHEGEHAFQANRSGWIRVRTHADGRTLVYGGYDTRYQGERQLRAGELLESESGDMIAARVPAAIHRVAEAVNATHIAEECIANLPAVEI